MNNFEKFLIALQATMPEPAAFGWYHSLWIVLSVLTVAALCFLKKRGKEIPLNWILGVYGIVALVAELLKQVSWSVAYDAATDTVTWFYQWYAAPFQLCSTPMYVSILALFLKPGKLRESLLAYLSFITIIGGVATVLIPRDCLVENILANIYTMWLHCGAVVVAVYLLISGVVRPTKQTWLRSAVVFLVMTTIALALNIGVYHSGVLKGETFNMFYISPYFISVLPVFDTIQQAVSYPVFLAVYIIAILLGSQIVFWLAKLLSMGIQKCKYRDVLHTR